MSIIPHFTDKVTEVQGGGTIQAALLQSLSPNLHPQDTLPLVEDAFFCSGCLPNSPSPNSTNFLSSSLSVG